MEFDEAVLSRIHLKIWERFLSGARTHQGPAILDASELEHWHR
jgi:hypothetical protein